MRNPVRPHLWLLAGVLVMLASCGGARVERVWRDPEVARLDFARLLVVAPAPDGALRRSAEDAMCAAITAVPVVASYPLLPGDAALADVERLLQAARTAGADGVVTARLVGDRTEVDVVGAYPVAYRDLRGYWGPRYGLHPYDAAVVSTRTVAIEVCIYRVADARLAWTAVLSAANPTSPEALIADCATAARARLQADGLIPAGAR